MSFPTRSRMAGRLNRFDFLLIIVVCVIVCAVLWGLSAQAQGSGRTATVTVTKPTKDVENNTLPTPVILNYYQSVNAGPYTKVATTENATLTFNDLPPGQVCYKVSAQTATNPEGAQSPPGCKSFGFPAAGTPAAPVVN